ncbi:chorismate mutase [Salinicola corii]|uniref:chorismate mutase n=1 Tax=Salinicola corii TaxID=2606937 RepID=A0A640WAD5_9GAMM|nr:chorismate mutase [Salinicola corii]KAA0015548.1 chorismate mutase [Salinicola corii]
MKERDVAAQLASYRKTIDNIDAALVYILAERFRCTNEIGLLKAEHDFPPVDEGREQSQYARLRTLADDAELDQVFIERLIRTIIDEAVRRHGQIAADHFAKNGSAT